MPKPNRNNCKNNGEHTVLTYYQLQFNTRCQKCCVQKSQMGYSRKISKQGGGGLRTRNFQELLLARYLLAVNHQLLINPSQPFFHYLPMQLHSLHSCSYIAMATVTLLSQRLQMTTIIKSFSSFSTWLLNYLLSLIFIDLI